jgi:O-antigen/teichoic acid export membrane protein
VAPQFALNSLFGALAGASITLANFLSGIIVARTLGVNGAGAVAYAVWLALVIVPVFDLGASSAVGRYVPEMRARGACVLAERLSGQLARILVASVLTLAALFIVLGVFFLLSRRYMPRLISDALRIDLLHHDYTVEAYWGLTALYVTGQVLATYVYSYLRGCQRFGTVFQLAISSLVVQVMGVAAGSLMCGINGAIAGYAVGQILPALPAIRLVAQTGPVDDALLSRVRYYARYAWAANVANAFVWSRLEIFFLERYAGDHDVGIFAAALTLANLAIQGPILLTAGVLPLLSEQRGRGDHEAMKAANEIGTRLLAALVFPSCLGIAAIMPVLVPWIYGFAFVEAIPAAIVIVCAACLSATTVIGAHLIQALERSDFGFFSAALGASLSVLSGIVLVPKFGVMGAVLSRALIQTFMVALGAWFIITRLGYSMPFASLLRLLCAAIISAVVAHLLVVWCAHPLILIVAIPAAAASYLVALRSLAAVPVGDLIVLDRLSRALPIPAARIIQQLLNFVGGSMMLARSAERTL